MFKTKVFPKLFGYSRDGRVKQWSVYAADTSMLNKPSAEVVREHGFVDKKLQRFVRPIVEGKNIGKKNETSPFEQACSEAQSLWNAKKDEGYNVTPEKQSVLDLVPMLAQSIKDGSKATFPADLQPKLNGVRCIAKKITETQMRYVSRKGKTWTLNHLTPYLLKMLKVGQVVDGEIFTPGLSLNKIAQLVKKYRPGETEQLQYWLYDMPDPLAIWKDRLYNLRKLFEIVFADGSPIVLTPTVRVMNAEEAWSLCDAWIDEGFEGAILRNLEGKYVPHRSHDLLKLKKFLDQEFKIIGGKEGKGRDKGCVIFQCICDGGDFWVRPMGTVVERQAWLKDLDNIIGKELTVKFLEWSDYNKPQGNTVGVAIRDYE